MKLPNLSKITKYIKFPKFYITINTFLMLGLFVFYLAIIISDFSIKTFEKFTQEEQTEIDALKNRLNVADFHIRALNGSARNNTAMNSKNIRDNASVMTKLIPDIQKNVIDLSNNLYRIESKIGGLQPSPIEKKDVSVNITPIPK